MSYWIGVLLATIGASLIIGALTYVSALIGLMVNAMIVLMCGPIIDRVSSKRGRARKTERRRVALDLVEQPRETADHAVVRQ
jgi:hypothetical protein